MSLWGLSNGRLKERMKNRPQAQWARRRVWTFRWCNFEGPTPVRSRPFAIPCARVHVPMLSMVEYSCTVQLFSTAVLCHVINWSVTSSDTSIIGAARQNKTTRKIRGERRKKDRERGLFLRHGGACPWWNGRSLPAIMRDFANPRNMWVWECHC